MTAPAGAFDPVGPLGPDPADRRPPRGSAWGALFYLYGRAGINRLRVQIARLRSPRYLLALLLGLGYFYLALGRGPVTEGRSDGVQWLSPEWVSLFYALFILLPWFLYARVPQLAIAFSPAEVQWLLPAPLSRRELINAKLLKSQLGILLNVVVFLVILRGEVGSWTPWMRAIALYLIFSTQTLHALGAALTRAEIALDPRGGLRRLSGPLLVLGTVVALLATAVLLALPALRAASGDAGDLIRAFGDVLRSPAARAALFPVRLLIAPLFATTPWQWLLALPGALLIPVLHYWWVVRTNVAFEELATDASARQATRVASRRDGTQVIARPDRVRRIPPLASRGRVELAIIWKNVAAAVRIGGITQQVLIFAAALAVFGVMLVLVGGESGDVLLGIGTAWLMMFLVLGPIWNRYDLRFDLPRLAILRSWPISGARIVASMIACTAGLHVLLVWTLIGVLALLAGYTTESLSAGEIVRIAVIVAAIVPSVSALMFTVQNAAALLFPAWVRSGPQQRGLEAIGQNLLTMLATLVLVLLGAFYPGFAALVTALYLWRPMGGAWALVPAALVGLVVVLAELVPAVRALGDVFEHTEPKDVSTEG